MSDRPDNRAPRNDPPRALRNAPSVDSLLTAAVRAGASADSAGEARAVAAFRAARDSGGRTARTRRRDDWRPNARRRVLLSIRTTLAALLAGLTLGGVAFAAIGSATPHDKGADREPGSYGNQGRPGRTTDRTTADDVPTRPGPADVPPTDLSTQAPPPDASAPAEPDQDQDQDGVPARNTDDPDRRAGQQADQRAGQGADQRSGRDSGQQVGRPNDDCCRTPVRRWKGSPGFDSSWMR